MLSQSSRKPVSDPFRKRHLPGDPEPRPIDPIRKRSLPGDPKPRPKKPGALPEPMPKPSKR